MRWESIGDPVMGGVSTGRLDAVDATTSVFQGEVSLAHGGGFASVKADIAPVDLSACGGIRLHVRGDGKVYKLGLRTRVERNAPVYQHPFETSAGQWQRLTLAFRDFTPRLRGRTLTEAPPLDPARIASVSLYISGGQAGAFALHMAGAIQGI